MEQRIKKSVLSLFMNVSAVSILFFSLFDAYIIAQWTFLFVAFLLILNIIFLVLNYRDFLKLIKD
jgi:hypothetical protein